MKLFDGRTTDGDSANMSWPGGLGTIQVAGTFNGATVTLHASLDDGTTFTATDAVFTAAGFKNIEIVSPAVLKLTLTDDGASTDIDAWIER